MKNIPLLLDKPIDGTNENNKDAFGHEHYAEMLFEILTNEKYNPPFNIGLLGKWGVGKSSIKEIIQKKLLPNSKNKDKIYFIDFNAWKYGGNGIKKALLRHVYLSIDGTDEAIKDEFSRQITKQVLELNENREILKNGWNVFWNFIQIISIIVVVYVGYVLILKYLGSWGATFASIPFLGLAGFLVKEALKKNNLLIPIFQNITKMDTPSTTVEVYETFLIKQIEEFKKIHKKITKIVVFVDDLDRLSSAKEMIEGINAIKNFMDIKLPNDIGVIFILSCCEDKISEALLSVKEDDDKKAGITNDKTKQKMDAKRFLDKIFQFRIDIPPFPYQDMVAYTKELLIRQIPDYKAFETELIKGGTTVENLLCRLIHSKVQNPRQAIQIINAFLQSWNIAKQREKSSPDSKGGLKEGIVTKNPLTLATLAVLKVDFPYFYRYLLEEPKLLHYALETIRTKKEPNIYIDEKIKQEFIEGNKIKADYYELDLYLSSINSKFKLPASLKPFLLLNQDPLSREYGEDAELLTEALITKKSDRIIKIFGLSDDKALSKSQADLLLGSYQSISYEEHQQNAFICIIDLLDYFNEETAFVLNEITNSIKNNRGILTVDDFNKLLYKVINTETNNIIEALKEQFLDNNYVYQELEDAEESELQNGLFDNYTNAIKILLEYYKKKNIYDKTFLSNTLFGRFGYFAEEANQKPVENFLSFDFINECVSIDKDILKSVGVKYINKLIAEFKDLSIDEIKEKYPNTESIFNNIKYYLDFLIESKNNELFLNVFKAFINVSKNVILYTFAFSYLKENFDKLDNNLQKVCLSYLVNDLTKEIVTPTENKAGILKEILDFVKEKIDILNKDEEKVISDLIIKLSVKDDYIDWALELYSKFKNVIDANAIEKHFVSVGFSVADDIIHKAKIRDNLTSNYILLSNEIKKDIIEKICAITLISAVSLPDANKIIFENFIQNIEQKNISKEFSNTSESLRLLFEAIYQFFNTTLIPNNYNKYSEQLFPIIKPYFRYTNSSNLATLLLNLCINAEFTTDTFKHMDNIWSELNQNIWENKTELQGIFDFAIASDELIIFSSLCKLFNSAKILRTDENFTKMFEMAHKFRQYIGIVSDFLTHYKKNLFDTDQVVELLKVSDTMTDEEKSAVKKLGKHFVSLLSANEQKEVTKEFLRLELYKNFSFWCECVREQTNNLQHIVEILNEQIRSDSLLKLLQNRTEITKNFKDKDRKILATTILNTVDSILSNTTISQKDVVAEDMVNWAYDFYNDIIKDISIDKFSEELRKLIWKTMGKAKVFEKINFEDESIETDNIELKDEVSNE